MSVNVYISQTYKSIILNPGDSVCVYLCIIGHLITGVILGT